MLKYGDELREASPGIMLGADGGFTIRYSYATRTAGRTVRFTEATGDHCSATEPTFTSTAFTPK